MRWGAGRTGLTMRGQRIPGSIHHASLALMTLPQVPHSVRSAIPQAIATEIAIRDYSLNPRRHNLLSSPWLSRANRAAIRENVYLYTASLLASVTMIK